MKKFAKIVEGFAINVAFALFGFFFLKLFCFLVRLPWTSNIA